MQPYAALNLPLPLPLPASGMWHLCLSGHWQSLLRPGMNCPLPPPPTCSRNMAPLGPGSRSCIRPADIMSFLSVADDASPPLRSPRQVDMRLPDIQGQLELLQRQQEGGGSNGWGRQAMDGEGVAALWTGSEAGLMEQQLRTEDAATSGGPASAAGVAGRDGSPSSCPDGGDDAADGVHMPQRPSDASRASLPATLPHPYEVPMPAPPPALRLAPVFQRPDGSSLAEVLQLPLRGLLQEEDPGSPMYYKR